MEVDLGITRVSNFRAEREKVSPERNWLALETELCGKNCKMLQKINAKSSSKRRKVKGRTKPIWFQKYLMTIKLKSNLEAQIA